MTARSLFIASAVKGYLFSILISNIILTSLSSNCEPLLLSTRSYLWLFLFYPSHTRDLLSSLVGRSEVIASSMLEILLFLLLFLTYKFTTYYLKSKFLFTKRYLNLLHYFLYYRLFVFLLSAFRPSKDFKCFSHVHWTHPFFAYMLSYCAAFFNTHFV